MKKIFLLAAFVLPVFAFAGGPSVLSAIVPQYMQGVNGTNNSRVPIWFWGQIAGLTPAGVYHYYTTMDTLNASSTSNGAGNPYFLNPTTGVIRRTTNPSMTANTGYDSLVADSLGVIEAWFAVEPTGNGRFTPGAIVYPKIMLNNGAGGTTVLYRLLFSSTPVTVINFGTTTMSATQGSALYDSLDAAPKNFICAYDNILAVGRPVNIGIVENDQLDLYPITSIANFYQNSVDTMDSHWGIIVPNNLPNGIQALEERSFASSAVVDVVTDADGWWCYGTNTVNMSNGNAALYLNSTFILSSSAIIPDTAYSGIAETFYASSNSPNSTYTWNYGDLGTGNGDTTTHTYITPGVVNAQVIISTGGCTDTINQTVVVLLTTGIITPMPLSFQVMPNPTEGEFYISTKDHNEKMIVVTDVLGQIVLSQLLTGNKISMNIAGQKPGIYFIEVRDTVTGKTGVKKMILQ
ncbi:MAG: T9SS type A sorting domain-containing protein [Bacteroidota bacterium]|nr:T9SS type A sorting domain-containing protein [Bacteroidota bacterium]